MVQTTVAQPASVDPVAGKLPHVPSQQSVLDVSKNDELSSPGAQAVTAIMKKVGSASAAERQAAAKEVVEQVKSGGVGGLVGDGLLQKLKAAVEDSAQPLAREGALAVFTAVANSGVRVVEPYIVSQLDIVLERYADKVKAVADEAAATAKAILGNANPAAVRVILPLLFAAMEHKRKWQVKVAALKLMSSLKKTASKELQVELPAVVPEVAGCFADAKPQVKTQAVKTLTEACGAIGNRDIEPFVPAVISCMANPNETAECVHKLSATTFVQAVEAPALSIMVPLLVRGLRERVTAIKRKSCVIIDNMSKLVENPADAAVFLPRLLPGVKEVAENVSDPECRSVAAKAQVTLLKVGAEGEQTAIVANEQEVLAQLRKECAKVGKGSDELVLQYVTALTCGLINRACYEEDAWKECVVPYLPAFLGTAEPAVVAKGLLSFFFREMQEKTKSTEEFEEGEDLCNCEFSLAYGGKILLNNARLHLKRGKRYGLCGPNGAGKSTLMRAISNGQLDGFPPKSELRTVYVEHDIDSSESDMAVVEFVYADKMLQDASHPSHGTVEEVLTSVGFTDEMQNSPVGSLSGGWKMKLALARAMLMKADIMLLDEPTNHLDVNNVAWLEGYLTNLPNVTSMVVSHDSGFLDHVCTGIIHYESRKLKHYKGNLSEFVKKVPEARSYYSLEDTALSFKFPEPGFLDGIKTKDKAILKMTRVGFTYPGTTKRIVEGASLAVTLNSRVAVIGANGAGKSTLIKVLTGELEASDGTVTKHPNLRVAYVAQHAFHHIEKHLDKTPNEYIQWRYAGGEDREEQEKVSRQVNDEDEKKMSEKHVVDGVKRVVEKLVARRKLKRSYEYEVQWQGMPPTSEFTTWFPRDKLEEMGFVKMVNDIDAKEAANQGMIIRPLTQANIQKHLEAVGLESEFATHSRMRGLSGGQRMKCVMGAATWNNPHIIVLDEPSNFLDRDSLGALTAALKNFGGGVLIISHNKEFTDTICPTQWVVANGKVQLKGEVDKASRDADKLDWKQAETTLDALGNTVKVKGPKKKLSNKEKKQKAKVRKARRERGEEVSDTDEDE